MVPSFLIESAAYQSAVSCSFDANAGTGSVPHELLELLEPGAVADVKGTFRIAAYNTESFMAGNLRMTFVAQTAISLALTFSK